jgi:hypothetical protein
MGVVEASQQGLQAALGGHCRGVVSVLDAREGG